MALLDRRRDLRGRQYFHEADNDDYEEVSAQLKEVTAELKRLREKDDAHRKAELAEDGGLSCKLLDWKEERGAYEQNCEDWNEEKPYSAEIGLAVRQDRWQMGR